MESCVPLPIEDKLLNDLVEKAKDYLLMHGICMRRKDAFDKDALHFAPFMLLPSPFPRQEFKGCLDLQPTLNILMHRVAHDHKFLTETLESTVKVDSFTRHLFDIYKTVYDEGMTQSISLGLFRSDFFYCCNCKAIKQVEFNTVASSFGGLSSRLVDAQKYILREMGKAEDTLDRLPQNRALQGLARGMLKAWEVYQEKYEVLDTVILFIIEDVTYNICDQKFMEFECREQNPKCFIIRKTLTEVADAGCLDKDSKALLIEGKEVALIYFRCGYSPDQYGSDKEWQARLTMERSRAIKSPSIQYHLAGTKKVQQKLAEPGVLEHFLDNDEDVAKVRSTFTGLYHLDDDEAVQRALKNPKNFVLKPQREGGGNNIYGDDIVPFLTEVLQSDEKNAYILMDRLSPPVTTNYMVRPGSGDVQLVDVVSELGIFGCILGDNENNILANEKVGHMLRTKLSHVNEGGVAAGLGALDSVYLVDVDRCCNNCANFGPTAGQESCCQRTNNEHPDMKCC